MPSEIDVIVQKKYSESLKKAKVALKKGSLDDACAIITSFFEDNQEELAQYFGSKSVEETKKEMLDRIEQAQATLAPVMAENPEKTKKFMNKLNELVIKEFDAFKEMRASSA